LVPAAARVFYHAQGTDHWNSVASGHGLRFTSSRGTSPRRWFHVANIDIVIGDIQYACSAATFA